jgi:hypothetical protein
LNLLFLPLFVRWQALMRSRNVLLLAFLDATAQH